MSWKEKLQLYVFFFLLVFGKCRKGKEEKRKVGMNVEWRDQNFMFDWF